IDKLKGGFKIFYAAASLDAFFMVIKIWKHFYGFAGKEFLQIGRRHILHAHYRDHFRSVLRVVLVLERKALPSAPSPCVHHDLIIFEIGWLKRYRYAVA